MLRKSMLSVGDTSFSITALGPTQAKLHNIPSWSLQPLQTHEGIGKSQALIAALTHEVSRHAAKVVLAPHVAPASARIIASNFSEEISTRTTLGRGVELHRHVRTPADGIVVREKEAFIMSGAGCPVIIASCLGRTIVAHAARDSLLDRSAVLGQPSREHMSVVQAILRVFSRTVFFTKPAHVSMCLALAIPKESFAHDFAHPVHGSYNRALFELLRRRWPRSYEETGCGILLDIAELFRAQAQDLGIENVQTAHSLAEHPDLCHTRDGGDPGRRNLVIVERIE